MGKKVTSNLTVEIYLDHKGDYYSLFRKRFSNEEGYMKVDPQIFVKDCTRVKRPDKLVKFIISEFRRAGIDLSRELDRNFLN